MIYVYHDLYFFYFKTEEGSPVLLFRKQEAPKRRISHVLAREQGKKSSVKPVYKEDSSFMDAMKTDQKKVSKKSIPQKKIHKPQAKMRKPSQDTLKTKRMAEETHSRNDVLQPVTNSFYGEGSFSPVISDDEEKAEKKASAGKKKRVRFAAALESIKEIPSRKSDVWKMVSF